MSETLENVVAVEAIKEAEEAAKEEVAIEVATSVEPESLQYFPQERQENNTEPLFFISGINANNTRLPEVYQD